MKHLARMRRFAAVIALAGFAVAIAIGFAHVFQPDPGYTGGLHHSAQVVRTDSRMKPNPDWGGGRSAVTPSDRTDWDAAPESSAGMQ